MLDFYYFFGALGYFFKLLVLAEDVCVQFVQAMDCLG